MNERFFFHMTGQLMNKRPQLSDFTFNHSDIWAGPIEIERNLINFEVRVPANTWLVLVTPDDDRPMVINAGIRTIGKLGWGRYQGYLVSQSTQTLNVGEKRFTTSDGWDITLSISNSWRVQDARRIVKLLQPAMALEKACLNAITTTIQKHRHNDLIGVTQPPTILANALAKEIGDQITVDCRLYGMVVEQVSVCNIRGDERLVNPQLDACAAKSALSTSIETIEMRSQAQQKEAQSRQQMAEIDRKIQIIENEGMVAAKNVEFRHNLALKLVSTLPELLKNTPQGVAGTMYTPQNSEIIEATLQRIESLLLTSHPHQNVQPTIENFNSYKKSFVPNNLPTAAD